MIFVFFALNNMLDVLLSLTSLTAISFMDSSVVVRRVVSSA